MVRLMEQSGEATWGPEPPLGFLGKRRTPRAAHLLRSLSLSKGPRRHLDLSKCSPAPMTTALRQAQGPKV
ncbi:hypothetical protein SAMN06295973_2775 [Plantibacter cousiniae]|uniref:Uncharacterized protein n=1 Tax=Plantibacter cousiniae (nom. nud.) TaxID=199709 RepID=A0ABY1LND0_9MICO|nr:hypothetical protein SAMN06295973_2775 [Plantibacter cousiniae]